MEVLVKKAIAQARVDTIVARLILHAIFLSILLNPAGQLATVLVMTAPSWTIFQSPMLRLVTQSVIWFGLRSLMPHLLLKTVTGFLISAFNSSIGFAGSSGILNSCWRISDWSPAVGEAKLWRIAPNANTPRTMRPTAGTMKEALTRDSQWETFPSLPRDGRISDVSISSSVGVAMDNMIVLSWGALMATAMMTFHSSTDSTGLPKISARTLGVPTFSWPQACRKAFKSSSQSRAPSEILLELPRFFPSEKSSSISWWLKNWYIWYCSCWILTTSCLLGLSLKIPEVHWNTPKKAFITGLSSDISSYFIVFPNRSYSNLRATIEGFLTVVESRGHPPKSIGFDASLVSQQISSDTESMAKEHLQVASPVFAWEWIVDENGGQYSR